MLKLKTTRQTERRRPKERDLLTEFRLQAAIGVVSFTLALLTIQTTYSSWTHLLQMLFVKVSKMRILLNSGTVFHSTWPFK